MADSESLRSQQFAFSAHLRDPLHNPPPPGIEDRRLAVYRDLFFNNIDGLLASGFPVIRQTLGDDAWRTLVRAFYAEHRCQAPVFPEVAREFIRYLDTRAEQGRGDAPWLPELAHYEWVELGLQTADDALPAHDAQGDLLAGVPVPSPLAWALAYRWPVAQLGPGYQPTQAPEQPTLLLVRRDRDFRIHFAQLSPLAFRLWELLQAGDQNGHAVLHALAAEAGVAADADFIAQGAGLLTRMRDEGSVLGTRMQVG